MFLCPLLLAQENLENVVLASCALHNFLHMKCPSCYTPSESFDKECLETGGIRKGEWRNDFSFRSLITQRGNRCRTDGKVIREKFCLYFNASGQVPWQNKFIF